MLVWLCDCEALCGSGCSVMIINMSSAGAAKNPSPPLPSSAFPSFLSYSDVSNDKTALDILYLLFSVQIFMSSAGKSSSRSPQDLNWT